MAGFHMDEALSLQDANSAAIQALAEVGPALSAQVVHLPAKATDNALFAG